MSRFFCDVAIFLRCRDFSAMSRFFPDVAIFLRCRDFCAMSRFFPDVSIFLRCRDFYQMARFFFDVTIFSDVTISSRYRDSPRSRSTMVERRRRPRMVSEHFRIDIHSVATLAQMNFLQKPSSLRRSARIHARRF